MSTEPEQQQNDSPPTEEPGPDRWGRKGTLWLALVVIVAVVSGGVYAVFRSAGADNSASGADRSSPQPVPPQTPRQEWGLPYTDELGRRVEIPPNPDGIALDQDDAARTPATDTVTLPSKVQWQKVRNFPLPFSTSDGPTGIDGRMATGFAQTPRGAALAGMHLFTRGTATAAGAVELLDRHVITDSEQAEQSRRRVLDQARAAVTTRGPDALGTPAMFRVDAYRITQWAPGRPDYAVVEYAMLEPSRAGWVTLTLDLHWREGDWQLELGDHLYSHQGTASNLGGWTQWPAN